MESMNLLDITIRYFNTIIFVLCVLFGTSCLFACWIAWREVHRKQNIIRSVIAAYNIAEDALERGRSPRGDFQPDASVVQTVLNGVQEILNAVHGEITGKPIPTREDRLRGIEKSADTEGVARIWKRRQKKPKPNIDTAVPTLMPEENRRQHAVSHQ
jgi:hypothetical protein